MKIELVPIRVGMILIENRYGGLQRACPHTRGDDPLPFLPSTTQMPLSPYAWG